MKKIIIQSEVCAVCADQASPAPPPAQSLAVARSLLSFCVAYKQYES